MKISIVIPTFNYDKYIARAIRSCIEQSFDKKEFEIIVVNDSSKDSTRHILKSYGHWIQVVEHVENKGLPHSRNEGIKRAKGEFIVNLDADDYLHREFLNICSLYMNFNRCDAVATDYYLVDDNESILKRISVHEHPIACGIMFRKKQMVDVGLYDTAFHIGEDVDFRLRYDKKYRVESIALPLYRYRLHKDNLTSNKRTNRLYLDKVARKNACEIDHTYPSEKGAVSAQTISKEKWQ